MPLSQLQVHTKGIAECSNAQEEEKNIGTSPFVNGWVLDLIMEVISTKFSLLGFLNFLVEFSKDRLGISIILTDELFPDYCLCVINNNGPYIGLHVLKLTNSFITERFVFLFQFL